MRKGSRRRLSSPSQAAPRHSRRPLLVESLEVRAVLSASCELIDGLLSIQCSPSDDAIAIQLDPAAATVQVLDDEKLIGLFPAAAVDELSVTGLGPGDLVAVDTRLAVPLSLHNGSFGVFFSSANSIESIVHDSSPLRPIDQPLIVDEPGALTGAFETIVSTLPAVTQADLNSPLETDTSLLRHQVAFLQSERISAATDAAVQSDTREAAASLPTADDASADTMPVPLASGGLSDPESDQHELHLATRVRTDIAPIVANEQFTAAYSAHGVPLVDDAQNHGRRHTQRTAEQARAAAVDQALAQPEFTQTLRVEFPAGDTGSLPGEFVQPRGIEEFLMESLSAEGPATTDPASDESPWLERLQIAGLSLMAVGVSLIPLVWRNRKLEEQAVDDSMRPDSDWLGGRFHVEMLRP
jgi:hypothetical protein